MTRAKRFLSLLLALALALSLTACSKETLSDMILHVVTVMGLRPEVDDGEEEVPIVEATAGGSVVFPEDFEYAGERIANLLRDGVLYVAFNGITNRSCEYFVATGSSITVTAYATSTNTEAKNPPRYKVALWELSEDMTHTSYLPGTTIYFSAAGEGSCYTTTISGLTPGRRYKVNISYDTTKYFVSGGMAVSGVSNEDLLSIEEDES